MRYGCRHPSQLIFRLQAIGELILPRTYLAFTWNKFNISLRANLLLTVQGRLSTLTNVKLFRASVMAMQRVRWSVEIHLELRGKLGSSNGWTGLNAWRQVNESWDDTWFVSWNQNEDSGEEGEGTNKKIRFTEWHLSLFWLAMCEMMISRRRKGKQEEERIAVLIRWDDFSSIL